MNVSPVFAQLLHGAGLKATPGRLGLLRVLSKNERPLTTAAISKKLEGIDPVTVYRALEAMVEKGLVRRVDTQNAYTHYELVATRKHHHHAICIDCGKIADVDLCLPKTLEEDVLKSLKSFSAINNHSLEFIGRCNQCARQ